MSSHQYSLHDLSPSSNQNCFMILSALLLVAGTKIGQGSFCSCCDINSSRSDAKRVDPKRELCQARKWDSGKRYFDAIRERYFRRFVRQNVQIIFRHLSINWEIVLTFSLIGLLVILSKWLDSHNWLKGTNTL